MKVSVIVVNYNTRDLTRQCLASLEKFCPQAEVIVVDNASRDGSVEMIRNEFPAVKLHASDRNLGFAAANNLGLTDAQGEYLVLFNSDATLEDDSLERCLEHLDQHPQVGAMSPRLMGVDDHRQQCLYAFPTLGGELRQALRMVRDEQPIGQWLAGTALILRAAALAEIGGQLDASYFMYWEDCDLSARLIRQGWQVAEYPDVYIRHYGGASGGGPDSIRRADLYAWYMWGKHRWFSMHRPRWESACVWLLDFADVFRKLARGAVRPQRRGEWTHAGALARVLGYRLLGLAPARP